MLSWEERMAARARVRREAAEAVLRAEQEPAEARERAEFLATVPPPCPRCYTVALNMSGLMWVHDPDAEDEVEGFPTHVCTCGCHPEPVRWPMIALAATGG